MFFGKKSDKPMSEETRDAIKAIDNIARMMDDMSERYVECIDLLKRSAATIKNRNREIKFLKSEIKDRDMEIIKLRGNHG